MGRINVTYSIFAGLHVPTCRGVYMMLVPLSVARFIGRALESVCSRSSCFCVRFGSSMCGALVICVIALGLSVFTDLRTSPLCMQCLWTRVLISKPIKKRLQAIIEGPLEGHFKSHSKLFHTGLADIQNYIENPSQLNE